MTLMPVTGMTPENKKHLNTSMINHKYSSRHTLDTVQFLINGSPPPSVFHLTAATSVDTTTGDGVFKTALYLHFNGS